MKSVMKHQFSGVPTAKIQRSSFNRTHGHKTTFDGGLLVPFLVDEVLPGDTWNVNANIFARLATPIHPIMDNMVMETQFFFVPLRLVWDNFEKFMGAQDNPGDSTDFLIPQLLPPAGGFAAGGLADHFGLPTGVDGISVSALYHRAVKTIWNEWYRDQNLQNSITVDTGDGPDNTTQGTDNLLRRGKRHDYFTSCLPFPQKGDSIDLPLGDSAPLDIQFTPSGVQDVLYLPDGTPVGNVTQALQRENPGAVGVTDGLIDTSSPLTLDNSANLGGIADLSNATAATINSLRQAFQLQRMLERDARGGTRYKELILSHYRVDTGDARPNRPEFLGGGRQHVNINPVAQTNSTASDVQQQDTPQGNLAAFGTVSGSRNGFSKSFVEHGIVIGFVSVRADLTYQQGIPRQFSRKTKYDFYWPALAHLGEQAVLNKEIYAQGAADPDADEAVFGYQEAWAEYRYFPSKITGKFRSNDPQTLDAWHLSQEFASLPALNDSFIQDNPPIDRVIAVQDEPHFIFDSYIKIRCARPMPVYSVPGLIDHF